jgi:hypothetical protein
MQHIHVEVFSPSGSAIGPAPACTRRRGLTFARPCLRLRIAQQQNILVCYSKAKRVAICRTFCWFT